MKPRGADAPVGLRPAGVVTVALFLAACGGAPGLPRPPLAATAPAPVAPAPLPPEAGEAAGPAGTSGMGTTRYDAVGYAGRYDRETGDSSTGGGPPPGRDAITAAHRTLPPGSHAEVTALDTGRTILVLVRDRAAGGSGREIELSRGAARLLGIDADPAAPVRVRGITASPQDAAALAQGRPAAPRLNAPPSLLAALRRDLGGDRPPVPPAPRPPRGAAPPAPAGRYLVQVGAFSSGQRARALAGALGGRVESAGGLHRVRLGPFIDAAAAQRARDGAARRGYGDARIIVQ